MQNVSIQKAEDLAPEVKAALESLLGRPWDVDEEISILAFRPHESPQRALRQQVGEHLNDMMDAMAERGKAASDLELDEVLDEAMRSARPSYRRKQ